MASPPASNVGRFQYTGQAWLPEVGLHYYKARMYHPNLPRFMQVDPSLYGDGMNPYIYTHNDPVNFTDPTGMVSEAPMITVIGQRLPEIDWDSFNVFWRQSLWDALFWPPFFPVPIEPLLPTEHDYETDNAVATVQQCTADEVDEGCDGSHFPVKIQMKP